MKNIIKIIFFLVLLSWTQANMRLHLREENGRSVFERNSQYKVFLKVDPDGQKIIGAIGEIYIEYDTNIFTEITAFAPDYHALPSAIWESEKINFNHPYASGTGKRCIEYAKTDNNGPFWTISTTQNIYALVFKVKKNAPTGNTQIRFIYNSDNSRTKMISSSGAIFPLNVYSLNLYIDLDRTAPLTEISHPGGVYNSPPLVRLRPNEDAVIHHMVIGGSNIWEEQTVSANNWSGAIPLPYTAGQIKYSTIQYYGEDYALDKSHNLETIKAYLFTIDMENPVISNIQVPAVATPIGTIVEVAFDVFDQGGISNVQATIGGKAAYLYSGNGNGTYTFRRTIDGTEDRAGTLNITVTDTAGNSANDVSNRVIVDFAGPEFLDIKTNPVTPQMGQEIIISFRASELLRENPAVIVGDKPATFISKQNELNYSYRYTVTANGWYIDLTFLPDNAPPFTERNLPQKASITKPKNSGIYFRLGDSESSINTKNMFIAINGLTVYYQGDFISGFTGRVVNLDDRPNIFCFPPADFLPYQQVTLNISVGDAAGNTLNENYNFTTGPDRDTEKPFIANVYPSHNSIDVEANTPLYFELNDPNGCGIVRDRINLTINEVPLFAGHTPGPASTGQEINYPVLTNGVFQSGFNGSITPDNDGNIIISITPQREFPANKIINCSASFEDLARVPNTATGNWSFTTKRTIVEDSGSGRKPLAWPTIYDPTNKEGNKQLLTFNLKKAGETYLRIYDLSGDMIWEYKYQAEIGYQAVPWDGRSALRKIVGNGPYIWYIVQDNRVVGRGVSIIMK